MKKNELNYKDLKNLCNPDVFDFETTEELDNVGLVYGQERAVAALKFGLSINTKGYNLYVEVTCRCWKNDVFKRIYF